MRDEILKRLNTSVLGKRIIHTDVTDSTNNMAKEKSDMPEGTVFIADRQTNGRGRSGKVWISNGIDGLWMSILLKPELSPEKISCLTLVTGLAVVKALKNLTDADFQIKWPNDIVIDSKKVCGILCELLPSQNNGTFVVAGIGINLVTEVFANEISDIATSVKLSTGKVLIGEEVTAEFLNQFEQLYFKYLDSGFIGIVDEYKKYCATLNNYVMIISPDGYNKKSYAVDVNEYGELIVENEGNIQVVSSGEVSVRGLLGYV